MQGDMYRINELEGRSPPSKGVIKMQRICKKGSAWLESRQDRATWLITLKQGADIKLNKEIKTHEMQLQLDIYKGVPREMANIKFKRTMKLLLKDMAGLKRDSHNLKVASQHGYQMQKGSN